MAEIPLHVPVMPAEVLAALAPAPGQTLVDGTLGGGGHTRLLAEQVGPTGRVYAFDRDGAALAKAERNFQGMPVILVQASFAELPEVLEQLDIPSVDGILLDLGLSSDQMADSTRGFSFSSTGNLDLRFDTTSGEPAWRLLERLREQELANLIFEFGEEKFSRRIARAIVERRRTAPIRTACDLAEIVRRSVPRATWGQIDAATRTFQALRIATNGELVALDRALEKFPTCLRLGGRLAVISFHSLEDRRVKEAFRGPGCWNPLTKKPVLPTPGEIQNNPRSRSAKLRVAERVPQKP